jgi:hypothetical protein
MSLHRDFSTAVPRCKAISDRKVMPSEAASEGQSPGQVPDTAASARVG